MEWLKVPGEALPNQNLLFGDDGFDPETGSEPLKSVLCRVYPVDGD